MAKPLTLAGSVTYNVRVKMTDVKCCFLRLLDIGYIVLSSVLSSWTAFVCGRFASYEATAR